MSSVQFRTSMGFVQSPVQWEVEFFPGVKRPRRDVDHSPLSTAEVKKEWSYTSAPLYALYGVEKLYVLYRRCL
jgi:hypothetical protein